MQNFNYQGCGGYNYGMPQQPQRNEYAFVDGIEGARAFIVKPNSMMMLMDSNAPICYKKQVDMYGRTISLEVFDLVPHEDTPPEQYVTKKEFQAFIDSLKKEE